MKNFSDTAQDTSKTYVPKAPCKRCNTSLRFRSNYGCVECLRASSRDYHHNNRDAQLERMSRWAKENPEKNRANSQRWYEGNKEKANELRNTYRQNRWDEHYRFVYRSYRGKRRAALMQRTPPWADLDAINVFYKMCPEGMHVDHIVPLQGKSVSGLHVIDNLQYLEARENLQKGNRYE